MVFLRQACYRRLLFTNLDTKFDELLGCQWLWSLHDRGLAFASHREGLHLAEVALTGEVHNVAFDPEGNTTMWWSAIGKGLKHVTDFFFNLFIGIPHYLVDRLEQLWLVRSDTAATGLETITDKVVLRGENVTDVFALKEHFNMLRLGHREGVVGEGPTPIVILLKERKVDNPSIGENALFFVFLGTKVKLISPVLLHCLRVRDAWKWFLLVLYLDEYRRQPFLKIKSLN